MNHESPENERLQRWTRDALRQLGGPSAPPDFADSTLAQIRREARPAWYRLPWFQWPTAAQWASALALLTLTALLAKAGLPRWLHLVEHNARIHETTQGLNSLASASHTLLNCARMTLSHLPRTLVFTLSLCLASLWISTLGLGTACWRMAQRARHLP